MSEVVVKQNIKDINDALMVGVDIREGIERATIEARKERQHKEGIRLNLDFEKKENFIDKFTNYMEEITDAPPIFHQFMAYAAVSSLLQRKMFFPFGHTNVYPNMYLVLIAPSSTFRKTTSLNVARDLVYTISPKSLLPNEFSQEKLVENLALSNNGAGNLFYSEFKTLLGLMQRDYMQGAQAFLTDIYDGYGYSRETEGKGLLTIKEPYLNLFAATTLDWLVKGLKKEHISSGFLARFLFVIANKKLKSMVIPKKRDNDKWKELLDMAGKIFNINTGEVEMHPLAYTLYEDWYNSNEKRCENCGHDFPEVYSRLQFYVLKFSILNSALDFSDIITENNMDNAIRVVNYCIDRVEQLITKDFSFSDYERNKKMVFNIIEKAKRGGVVRSDLIRASRLRSKELDEILGDLIELEDIRGIKIKGIGKPKIMYFERSKCD